jgi:hypothetical protein
MDAKQAIAVPVIAGAGGSQTNLMGGRGALKVKGALGSRSHMYESKSKVGILLLVPWAAVYRECGCD